MSGLLKSRAKQDDLSRRGCGPLRRRRAGAAGPGSRVGESAEVKQWRDRPQTPLQVLPTRRLARQTFFVPENGQTPQCWWKVPGPWNLPAWAPDPPAVPPVRPKSCGKGPARTSPGGPESLESASLKPQTWGYPQTPPKQTQTSTTTSMVRDLGSSL